MFKTISIAESNVFFSRDEQFIRTQCAPVPVHLEHRLYGQRPDVWYLAIRDNNPEPVGWISYIFPFKQPIDSIAPSSPVLFLSYLSVREEFRNQRLATALIKMALDHGREMGAKLVALVPENSDVAVFYQKLGFTYQPSLTYRIRERLGMLTPRQPYAVGNLNTVAEAVNWKLFIEAKSKL